MILSISGLARSGKDSIGDMLVKKSGFKRIAMADILKEVVANTMNLPLNNFHDDHLKDAPFQAPFIFDDGMAADLSFELNQLGIDVTPSLFQSKLGVNFETPRHALIYIGTDVCRNLVDKDIWLNLTLDKIKKIEGHVVITDARFKNEREAIKRIGGVTMFVDRPLVSEKFDASKAHESELDQLNYSYDVMVINDRTLEALQFEISAWLHAKPKTLR